MATPYTDNPNPPANSIPLDVRISGDLDLSNILERLDCVGATLEVIKTHLATIATNTTPPA